MSALDSHAEGNSDLLRVSIVVCGTQPGLPRGASAGSLAESDMSAPDSHDEGDDEDSEASEGDVAEWDPQPEDAPPLAPGVTKLAEGVLGADVREVYSRILADQVSWSGPSLGARTQHAEIV